MNLSHNLYYQRYQPKPGSQLHLAIEATETARKALQEVTDGIASLEAGRARLMADLAAMSWRSKVGDIAGIQQQIAAHDQLLRLAQAEKERLNEQRRLANIPAHGIAQQFETQERLILERREFIAIHKDKAHFDKRLPYLELEIELAHKEIEKLRAEYC